MPDTRYDVAIVGAGFSGPILAAKIAEKGIHPSTGDRLKVALIEAGPYLKGDARPGYGNPVRRKVITNLPGDFPLFHWENGSAKLVGGSSLHWDGQAFLPFPMDYVHWEKETGVDWTEKNLKEAVEEIRQEFSIHHYPDEVVTPGDRLFVEVAGRMGYEPRRQWGARRNCLHCDYCNSPRMCRYDSRASTLWTYVPKAEEHGVDIIPDTLVEKILIDVKGERGVVRGLVCLSGGTRYQMTAEKVMICCGIRRTAPLLMHSGYGPPDWRGNPILVANPNVGQHIDGHGFLPGVSALFDEPMGDGEAGSLRGHFMIHDDRADGEGRLLFRASFGVPRLPDRAALNVFAPPFGQAHKRFMREKGILRTGSLRPSVAKPSGRWYFNPDGKLMLGGDHSLTIRRHREGLAIAHEVLTEMGASKVTSMDVPVVMGPSSLGAHLVGSCRAGIDPKTSVVDPYFESHDVDHLFVCDGSVIPRVTTGNSGTPQASVSVFAAQRIIERHFS